MNWNLLKEGKDKKVPIETQADTQHAVDMDSVYNISIRSQLKPYLGPAYYRTCIKASIAAASALPLKCN